MTTPTAVPPSAESIGAAPNCLTLHAPDRVCACGATLTSCGHWITMLFNRAQRAIVHDERWRRDLAAADLEAFDRLAGKLNRSFEYR